MNGKESTGESGRTVNRREVLATAAASGAVGLAGCMGPSSCALGITKTVDGEFHYGGQGTYVIEVCSLDDAPPIFGSQEDCDQAISVVDDLPSGITFQSVSGGGTGSWTASTSGGTVTLTNDSYGTLAPGDCLTAELTVDIAPASGFSGSPPHQVENCAQVQYEGDFATPDGESCVTHDITSACDLSLTKETAGEFTYGEQGTYVFEVCNEGEGTCAGTLDVTDELPAGLAFESVSGGGWTASTSGGTITVTNDSYGGLAPGECLSFEMTVSVAPPGEGPETVENCADLLQNGALVAEDCVSHPLSHRDCELSFEKSTGGTFHYGQEGTYVFEICNEGETECTGPLTVEDELPEGVSFVSAGGDWTGSASGGIATMTLDSHGGIPPGGCITVEMTVDVGSPEELPGDEIENCATLSHDGDTIAEDCIVHPVTSDPCELSLSKTVGSFGGFHYGGLGTYVLEVCNVGDVACEAPLVVEDELPGGISFASIGGDWTASPSGGTVTLTNDTHGGLDPGECLSVEMTVAVAPEAEFPGETGEIENCARLQYAGEVMAEDCAVARVTPSDACPPVEHVLDTGYDQSTATTLADGAADEDWRIVEDTTGSGPVPRDATVVEGSVADTHWGGPFPGSRWISHRADADIGSSGQTFEYQYCFCLLEGFSDPELSLRIDYDDVVADIRLNGTSLSYSGGLVDGPPVEEIYTDPGPFQAGENCLTIVVEDTVGIVSGVNVTGRVRAGTADCDCETGSECDLSLTKSTSEEFTYGGQHTYVYEICNDGGTECTGELLIEDDLPDGISFEAMGQGLTGPVNNGVVEATVAYSGLAPGECLTRSIAVSVAPESEFPGDGEVENCAALFHDGALVMEDCVTHTITTESRPNQ